MPKPRIVTEDQPSGREAELEAENKALKERVAWLESVQPERDWQALIAARDALASENEQLKAQIAIKREIL